MKINLLIYGFDNSASISKYLPKDSHLGNGVWQYNGATIQLNQTEGDFDYTFILDDISSTISVSRGKIFYGSAETFGCISYMKEDKFFAQFEKCFSCHSLYHHKNVTHSLPFQPFMIANHNGHDFFTQNDKVNYDSLLASKSYEKTKKISMIASNKAFSDIHIMRLEFGLALKKHFKDKLDLFGSGHASFASKADVIMPYKYHIVFENQHTPSVITEKLYDSYLGLSVPIYFGAPDVHHYFSKDSLELINPYNFKESVQKIEQILDENNYEKYLPHLIDAKEQVLNKYCPFKRIIEICKMDYETSKNIDTKTQIIYPRSHFLPKSTVKVKLITKIIKMFIPKIVRKYIKNIVNSL
ncbi:glycosyltransferase family 10 domain-containing protein [Candidatus Deianiraea vastatrix]|uniref:Glycosyltransferase family 10 (Fucosyltransferase) n=1 Tax=Candidatus Deianiraea vastatrix TaxID=2163644 RepID=A0A5B8XG59_9RICK|nr:glycosyltransferase family 10 [Candidatus Deianiraea vastatrix]QED23876.1 Putative glycosyltransferase family 10 (fucosyltransferase) [Candidatus Deianiraea vastatrix]